MNKIWKLAISISILATSFVMFNGTCTKTQSVSRNKTRVIKSQEVLFGRDQSSSSCDSSFSISENKDYKESIIFLDAYKIGCIAIHVRDPIIARFTNSKPQILVTPTFFTPSSYSDRYATESPDIFSLGGIEYNLILPSRCISIKIQNGEPREVCSEGTRDAGGEESQQSMYSVLRYMLGKKLDSDGEYVNQKFQNADLTNVGAFAFSHPGLLLNTTLANWGEGLEGISYVVMRENPTQALFATVELGDVQARHGCNPNYNFTDYNSDLITLDYSSVRWRLDENVPYFDLNDNNIYNPGDYSLHTRIPQLIYDNGDTKNLYTYELVKALRDNTSPKETMQFDNIIVSNQDALKFWRGRVTLGEDFDGNSYNAYTIIKEKLPDLRQIIVFASRQHVQTCTDAPSVHQAYDGYLENQMWTRLNPDSSYLNYILHDLGFNRSISLDEYVEIPANIVNLDWENGSNMGHASKYKGNLVSLAAIAELMDRTHFDFWRIDLPSTIEGREP